MKILFLILTTIHGLIHLMGFSKAFGFSNITQITKEISKPFGIFWLFTSLLFIVTAVLFLLKKDSWWVVGIIAIIISQILIFTIWQDAKFGTIPNVIIFVVIILFFVSISFERNFQKDVKENLQRNSSITTEILTENDLLQLPEPVKRYLKYAGVLNKPKVKNMRIVFEGEMRSKGKNYFPFTSVQYNFFDEPTRLFFMKGKMFGVTIPGYHKYSDAVATMDIRLFGLLPIVRQSGEILNKAETVTLLNDMCLLAPATLIDKRIKWQEIDNLSTRAFFTNKGITISATLYFNEKGQLVDFMSNDRTDINDMKQYPFYTPISEYQNINGINIMKHGEAIYQYPDEKFTYGKFKLKEVMYNVK